MKIISVVPYDERWPQQFLAEKSLIIEAIPVDNMVIHHIGSTSVKGLAAKLIIDILLEIERVEKLDRYQKEFEEIGYEFKGEYGLPRRRFFQKCGDKRSHQIHAFDLGSPEARRHLAFRDYLIAHKDVAKEYEKLKYFAAKECANDIEAYSDIKNDFVAHHERIALAWWQYA